MTRSDPVATGRPPAAPAPVRAAVVAEDEERRAALLGALAAADDVDPVAWSDTVESLLVLGTRAHVCLCAAHPPADLAARLAERGCSVVVPSGDPVEAVRQVARDRPGTAAPRRPALARRQREVLVAYVSSSDLLPTIARGLGMDPETFKTHLRRIRAKYAEAGRPAPTRRDLYVRAVEDGLLAPPSGRSWR
jgi:DNA-binding CsgD family transcriptional regulator